MKQDLGYKKLAHLGDDTLYGFYIFNNKKALFHIGKNLILWNDFPTIDVDFFSFEYMNFAEFTFLPFNEGCYDNIVKTTLKSNMQENKSVMFYFEDNVYIMDGKNYVRYNGSTLTDVLSEAYIPTTSISRAPSRWWRSLRRCKSFDT